MRPRVFWTGLVAAVLASAPAHAALTFEARLGGVVRVIDFDDVDTASIDPAPFTFHRYLFSDGARCDDVDLPPLFAPSAVAQCVASQELCEASQILVLDVPRGRELVEFYGFFIRENFFSGP